MFIVILLDVSLAMNCRTEVTDIFGCIIFRLWLRAESYNFKLVVRVGSPLLFYWMKTMIRVCSLGRKKKLEFSFSFSHFMN